MIKTRPVLSCEAERLLFGCYYDIQRMIKFGWFLGSLQQADADGLLTPTRAAEVREHLVRLGGESGAYFLRELAKVRLVSETTHETEAAALAKVITSPHPLPTRREEKPGVKPNEPTTVIFYYD